MNDFSITAYCTLDDCRIRLNEKKIFESGGISVKDFLHEAYNALKMDYPKFFKMDLLSKAGIIASDLLLSGCEYNSETVTILANSSSSLDTDRNYQRTIDEHSFFPSPALFVYTLPNIVLGEIAIKHKLYGESVFYINEQFEADAIFDYFCNSCSNAKRIIIGWVECTEQRCDVLLFRVESGNNGIKFNIDNINRIRNERTY